jgi:hypothetical protein
MPDLDQRIRDFIDLGAAPVTAREVLDSVVGLSGTPMPASSRRSGRRIVLFGSLVTVAALVLVVVGLSLNTTGIHAQAPPASAAAFLDKTASIAASQRPLIPGPGQFLYVRSIEASQNGMGSSPNPRVFRYYVQEVDEVWSSPHGVGRKSDAVVGQPLFITAVDRSTWEQDGSPALESGWGGGGAPIYFDVAHLPINPSKIKSYLDGQPPSVLPTDPTTGKDAVWEFNAAAQFLQHGASSRQRAALMRFMATIPGVRNEGKALTFGTHREGTMLEMQTEGARFEFQVIFDPKTASLLEIRDVVGNPSSSGSAPSAAMIAQGRLSAPLTAGQVWSYDDLAYVGIADSTTSPPKGAPPLPPAWPYGTTREPLPGSAYP